LMSYSICTVLSHPIIIGIMNKLIKLGAVTRPQEGKRGANSSRAAIYRREV
jgi:hypothetical protein